MPDYFTHSICAQKIYDRCSKTQRAQICDRSLYLLGAQGADVFFAYKLNFNKTNLGRKIHVSDPYLLFQDLIEGDLSYAAGFATHYALDCTLHPVIYAFERNTRSPLAHVRFENDLGLYVSRKYALPRRILPREKVLAETFTVYDSIKKIEPEITVTGVVGCLKRHFSYTRALIKSKRQSFTYDYDFASLSAAVDDGVDFGSKCVSEVLSGELKSETFSRSFLEK